MSDSARVSTSNASSEEAQLRRLLSLESSISTTSSPHIQQYTQGQEESFRGIGFGTCGIVYARLGSSTVVKLAKRGYGEDLLNDSTMHQKIQEQFDFYSVNDVKIPNWISFESNVDSPTFFDRHPALESAVGKNCEIPTSTLVTEHILPLSQPTRLALIEKYCPEHIRQSALDSPGNQDCLVRVYLGSMKGRLDRSEPGAGGRPLRWFTLRNFPLHLNQIENLGLDVVTLARRMGTAMAILHWAAKTDAKDVEFVLGSSSRKTLGERNASDQDELLIRTPDFWVLDFNQVQDITLDEAGVMMAVKAAKMNDPYIPKPRQGSEIEKRAWDSFVESYLAQSNTIFTADRSYGPENCALPRMFIEGLIGK
ncbi:hypothetical protein ED733_005601 [Metarhizium rileyi]|uniref:DUF3669 domain-containing protein n=1 Tax=Metarhizium rileyi (strain RCEF 4871) TaxID=1649241 RepID=A0A5C6GNQ6_METRR|nr:hypothetical protein ED733_005601 [Metarhizium rileyi]